MANYQPTQTLTDVSPPPREWKDSITVPLPANEQLRLASNTVVGSLRKIVIDVVSGSGPAQDHTIDVTYTRQVGETTVKAAVKKNGQTEGEDDESYPY